MRAVPAFILSLASAAALGQALSLSDPARLFYSSAATPAFSPDDVSGLAMWYKADAISASVGDEVTTWQDSSTSGWDLVGTAGATPYYTNSSEINSKPWLKFDGSNDFMRHGNGSLAQPCTAFSLVRFDVLPAASATVLDGTNSTTRMLMGITSAGAFQISGGTALSSAGSLVQTQQWVLFEATFNGATGGQIITNATTIQSGDAGTQASSGLYVGQRQATGRYLNGGLAEILIYTNNVSSGDRSSIRDYFTTKYGAYATW